MNRGGYTIIELVIVVAIVLILTASVLAGTGSLTRSLRFNNSFDKLILLVQQARSLAEANKDSSIKSYGVRFEWDPTTSAVIFSENQTGTITDDANSKLTLTGGTQLKIFTPQNCTPNATIRFTAGSADAGLRCEGVANPNVALLTLGIRDTSTANKTKTFSIHRVGGIPQVNSN